MRRRGVLLGLAGLLGGLGLVGAGSVAVCSRRIAAAEASLRLAEALPEVFAPARLAAHWQGPRDPDRLAAAVMARPHLLAALETDCIASRRAHVRAQIVADFAAGAMVVADRLVVADSECLIAALCLGEGGSATA